MLPDVGSSRKKIFGLATNSSAKDSLRFSPPLSRFASTLVRWFRFKFVKISEMICSWGVPKKTFF